MAMTDGTAKLVSSGIPPSWKDPVCLYVYYKEKSKNVVTNQTVLSLGMYVTTPDYWDIGKWTDWNGSYVGTATSGVNCKTFDGGIPNFSGTRWLVEDQDITITHEADGTKTVTIYWHWGVNSGWTGVMANPSGSFTIELTPIETKSEVSLGADSVQMGKKLLISIDSKSNAFVHTLTYTFGGSTATIATGVKSSYSWTVPDLASKCNNATSGTCTITCTTSLSGSSLGSSTAKVTLTVQDPTTPTITGSKVTMGTASSIACKRNSSNFKVKLEFKFKNTTVNIGTVSADTCGWTPSYDLAKLIPALTSGTGTLKCTTYNGTATVGTKSVTITVIVPENDTTRPSFTADGLKLTPISSLPEAFTGMFMRGKTGLKAEFTASSTYSTIKEYTLITGNQNAVGNPATIDLLVSEGKVKVTGKVTDARGFSTSVTVTITVMAYRNPKVTPYTGYSDVICERATATGELSADGTYLAIKAGKNFSSVVLNGVEMNSCALRYRWKPNGVDAYSEWITLLADGSAETEISLLVGNVVSSLQKSYMVEIEAVDALDGSHKLTFQIMTEAISFVLYDGPDGAGFGKYPEAPHVVDIASHMTLLVRGKMKVLGNDWVSIGLADRIGESGYNYGRKETGCFYLVTEGWHVHIAFNCMYVYAGTAVIVNATPIPEDNRPARPVFSLCPANDRQIACVSVGTDGYIRVEWVQKATDSVLTGNTDVTWLDGYLCYWT